MLSREDKQIKRTKKAVATRKKNREDKINSTYLNREWLFSRYCVDKMSPDNVASLCGVEYDVIWDALKQLGIPDRTMETRAGWEYWVERNKSKITYAGVQQREILYV